MRETAVQAFHSALPKMEHLVFFLLLFPGIHIGDLAILAMKCAPKQCAANLLCFLDFTCNFFETLDLAGFLA